MSCPILEHLSKLKNSGSLGLFLLELCSYSLCPSLSVVGIPDSGIKVDGNRPEYPYVAMIHFWMDMLLMLPFVMKTQACHTNKSAFTPTFSQFHLQYSVLALNK